MTRFSQDLLMISFSISMTVRVIFLAVVAVNYKCLLSLVVKFSNTLGQDILERGHQLLTRE